MIERAIPWERAAAIANAPEVEEALANFSEDSTSDNGVMVVSAVLETIQPEQPTPDLDFEDRVERATMILLGKRSDPSPGVNWECNRYFKVNRVRALMRQVLQEVGGGG